MLFYTFAHLEPKKFLIEVRTVFSTVSWLYYRRYRWNEAFERADKVLRHPFCQAKKKNFAKTAKHLVLYYASEVKLRHIGEYCLNLDLKRTWEPEGNSIIRDSSQNRYPHIFEDIQILMYSTVWKSKIFSANQFLREINFEYFRSTNNATMTIS